LIYGQGPQGLVDYAQTTFGVKISLEEAATFHQRFFAEYRALSRWHQDARKRANGDASETRTRLGRRRFLPGKTEYWPRFTQFLNTPVQGGCADGLKRAMVAIALALPAGSRIISTVHDEIIVESPEGDAETVKEMVGTIMIAEMSRIFPEVRIEAEAKICANWGEK
jgi:DNA polymerase-1